MHELNNYTNKCQTTTVQVEVLGAAKMMAKLQEQERIPRESEV